MRLHTDRTCIFNLDKCKPKEEYENAFTQGSCMKEYWKSLLLLSIK